MTEPLPYPENPPRSIDDLPAGGAGSLPNIWLRVAARLFDLLITAIPSLILALPYLTLDPDAVGLSDMPRWASVLSVIIPIVFEFVFLVIAGATPGKLLLGLRVVSYADGTKIAPYQAGLRVLLPGSGNIIGLLATSSGYASLASIVEPVMYVSSVYDPVRRGLHDKGAGTIVLRTR